jgi:hypothetical protein
VIWRPVNGPDNTHRAVRLTSSEQARGQVLRFAPAICFQQKARPDPGIGFHNNYRRLGVRDWSSRLSAGVI